MELVQINVPLNLSDVTLNNTVEFVSVNI